MKRYAIYASIGAFILQSGNLARAAIVSASEPSTSFGHTDQNSAGITDGGNACAATAVTNSFKFLQNTYPTIPGINNLGANTPVTTINALNGSAYMNKSNGSGVSASNFVSGKEAWINNAGLGNQISVHGQASSGGGTGSAPLNNDLNNAGGLPGMQNVAPTLSFLAAQLAAGQDVELGILWYNTSTGNYDGGHVITLDSITYNTSNGVGTLNFVDPFGGVDITGTITGPHNGFSEITYVGGAAVNPLDPDNPEDVGTADISFAVAESPVPEPTMLGTIAFVGLTLLRRRVRGCACMAKSPPHA
jgi:hypothetical protein